MGAIERGIDLLASGSYRVRVQQAGKPIKVPLCATLQEAITLRDGLYAKLAEGQFVREDGITAAQWGRTWLRKYRSENRAYRDDRARFELHIATAAFAQKAMAAVTPRDLLEWQAALRSKNTQHRYGNRDLKFLSYSTRKNCWGLVCRLFADAVTEELIGSSPAVGLRFKKTDDDKTYERTPKEWPLNRQEQSIVDQMLADDPERHIVDFAMGTGLRQGEQWNLRLVDVHLDAAKPHVWVRFGSKNRSPKNRKQRRVLLFGRALNAAREWLKILPEYAPYNPQGLMFPSPAREHVEGDGKRGARGGGRLTVGKYPDCWEKVKAGLGRHICWHHLRHTCATSLLCGLWDVKWRIEDVAILLGHSSTRTTEMYAHFLDNALEEPAAQTQAAWEARGRARDVVKTSSRTQISLEKMPLALNLRNRKSHVRIMPGAPGFPGDLKERAGGHDNLVTTARSLLVAVADGAPDAREKARELALADIEARGGDLALQVLSGDEFSLVRAVELARLALESAAGATGTYADQAREASHE